MPVTLDEQRCDKQARASGHSSSANIAVHVLLFLAYLLLIFDK